MTRDITPNCPDCGAGIGEIHYNYCDVERCAECGGQYISCGCPENIHPRLPWTGHWPGIFECQEFGWYCKFVRGKGWVSCSEEDTEATEDLNKLSFEAVWSVEKGRFIKFEGEDK